MNLRCHIHFQLADIPLTQALKVKTDMAIPHKYLLRSLPAANEYERAGMIEQLQEMTTGLIFS
jgi:hypothetical protein